MTSLAVVNSSAGATSASSSVTERMNGGSPDLSDYWKDDFVPLQSAGKEILQVLRKDESSPHGDLYRRILSTSSLSPSTAQPDTTPNHLYFADGNWVHSKSVPLPAFLQDQLSKAKISTLMGLFPQAHMAWMTIDDTIYLWSFSARGPSTSESEFLYFKVPSCQPIISAGLTRPKPGVFTHAVEWCLVVTTKEEAMLCALARKDHNALAAVLTNFIIPSDWVSFLSVTSTESGRIFLGGQDGHLYELDYDLLVAAQSNSLTQNTLSQLDNFYDGNTGDCPSQLTEILPHTTAILAQGKRALDALFSTSRQPPRKCRKLDHSQSTFSSFIPEVISKATSALLGNATTTGGGPIIHMAVDEERQVLYTLSTRGWICVLDIAENPKITLATVLDTPTTARLYLEAVSRGSMYAPLTSNAREGHLAFPGGGEAAQAGVGGMEGARKILKLAEQAGGNRRVKPTTSILTPVAIEVVPMRESNRITLVAITAGGLRYYLSSLHPNSLGAGPASQPFGTPRHRQSTRPHSKITLCHIRSPPSLDEIGVASSYHIPSQPVNQRVDAACYRLGVFFSAFRDTAPTINRKTKTGNVLIVTSVDEKARPLEKNQKDDILPVLSHLTPGGICETVSFPLGSIGDSIPAESTLPGGRVWDICAVTSTQDKVLRLALRSKTPTDTEIGFAMAPAYVPPCKRVSTKNATNGAADMISSKSTEVTHSVSSLAITVITNLLLSRPARYGIQVQRLDPSLNQSPPMYRVSKRSGVEPFSLSAADVKGSVGIASARSARLSPWLLTPEIVPLNPMTLQYYQPHWSTFLVLNAGGLHEFRSPSIIEQLASIIMNAGVNARSDQNVTNFFDAYGYAECCAMCLMLAMRPSSNGDLKEFAMRAALSRAYRPTVAPIQNNGPQHPNDPWVPNGYGFTSSALFDGLTLAVARLLRPFWYKPGVVVTEGRVLKQDFKTLTTPAKVELLFDDDVLHDVRIPLTSLQTVMRRVFSKAIENVPMSRSGSASLDEMEIDDDNHYLTRAIDYHRKGHAQTTSNAMRASEADELAQRIEERNIHSMYRLISRTAQLLSLLSHLRRAHSIPDLPEVDWGQLHGISIAQLVQSREGQDRLETTLNSLVTTLSTRSMSPNPSADAKQLAELLSEECYHFFSPGSRFAYFGFQLAHDALATPLNQWSRRKALALECVESLKKAASQWCSPSLVTGRMVQPQDFESYDKIAEMALDCDSLLAKACAFLAELDHVAALVEICLLTASNFVSPTAHINDKVSLINETSNFHWENELYHRKQNTSQPGSVLSSATAMVALVTAQDAVKTCHALIFHHLTILLNSPVNSTKYELGEKMVSVCAATEVVEFQHRFYAHLLESKHTEVLLRIESPALEAWLTNEKNGNIELLLRYYQIHEMHVEAGEVASNHASRMDIEIDLNERIEFLIYSIDSFARARTPTQSDQSEVQLKHKQCEERLRIARLQGRILQTISSTKYELSLDDLKPLQFRLLSANELLNRYSIPYDMFEYCLLLLHTCKHKDMLHIEQFWKSMLCDKILPCCTRNERTYRKLCSFLDGSLIENPTIQLLDASTPVVGRLFDDGTWMKDVEETVVRLGSEAYGKGENFVFPVEFITLCLEELRLAYAETNGEIERRQTLGWTCKVLVSAGVEHMVALRAYEQIVEKENHSTMGVNPRRRLEQIQSIIAMFESVTSSVGAIGSSTKHDELLNAYASGSLLASIEMYRSKLQCLPVDVAVEDNRLLSIENELKQYYG